MQVLSRLLSCAVDMRAAVEASRRHLVPWDAKQYALKVSLRSFSLASCVQQSPSLRVSNVCAILVRIDVSLCS
jgi:hypothetical protein